MPTEMVFPLTKTMKNQQRANHKEDEIALKKIFIQAIFTGMDDQICSGGNDCCHTGRQSQPGNSFFHQSSRMENPACNKITNELREEKNCPGMPVIGGCQIFDRNQQGKKQPYHHAIVQFPGFQSGQSRPQQRRQQVESKNHIDKPQMITYCEIKEIQEYRSKILGSTQIDCLGLIGQAPDEKGKQHTQKAASQKMKRMLCRRGRLQQHGTTAHDEKRYCKPSRSIEQNESMPGTSLHIVGAHGRSMQQNYSVHRKYLESVDIGKTCR